MSDRVVPQWGQEEEGALLNPAQTHAAIAETLRKATAALRDAEVPFALGGSVACWARGGPRSQNDLDLFVKAHDAERALAALAGVGMRGERPPEEWLLKAWDGDVMVDLIFESLAMEITDETIAAAQEMSVLGVTMRVLALEDILAGKLLAISEQRLEYGGLVEIARALREQIRWDELRRRTQQSPYARAFFALLAELGVIEFGDQAKPPPPPRADAQAGRAGPAAGVIARQADRAGARVCVLAPPPLVTVTIEAGDDGPEVHIHAGGQGFWVARMAALLGADVVLCTALGGEPGGVLEGLIEAAGIRLEAVRSAAPNGAYVHDRRSGERRVVAENPGRGLSRHELDELYGNALASGIENGVVLLTGPADPRNFPAELYGRLGRDLRRNGARVLADLSGTALEQALEAGIDLLKLSDEELAEREPLDGASVSDIAAALERVQSAGARNVVVTRAEQPAIARLETGRVLELTPPRFDPLDQRGAGDSLFAAVGVAVARGRTLEAALTMGMAAGALNVARRGLGSGQRRAVEALLDEVEVRSLTPSSAPDDGNSH